MASPENWPNSGRNPSPILPENWWGNVLRIIGGILVLIWLAAGVSATLSTLF